MYWQSWARDGCWEQKICRTSQKGDQLTVLAMTITRYYDDEMHIIVCWGGLVGNVLGKLSARRLLRTNNCNSQQQTVWNIQKLGGTRKIQRRKRKLHYFGWGRCYGFMYLPRIWPNYSETRAQPDLKHNLPSDTLCCWLGNCFTSEQNASMITIIDIIMLIRWWVWQIWPFH